MNFLGALNCKLPHILSCCPQGTTLELYVMFTAILNFFLAWEFPVTVSQVDGS